MVIATLGLKKIEGRNTCLRNWLLKMTTITIDTLATMRKLEKAGFKTEQAEAVTEVVAHQGDELATKADIAGLWQEVKISEKSLQREINGLCCTFGILFGFLLPLNLTMFGFLFAVWRDVATLTAG